VRVGLILSATLALALSMSGAQRGRRPGRVPVLSDGAALWSHAARRAFRSLGAAAVVRDVVGRHVPPGSACAVRDIVLDGRNLTASDQACLDATAFLVQAWTYRSVLLVPAQGPPGSERRQIAVRLAAALAASPASRRIAVALVGSWQPRPDPTPLAVMALLSPPRGVKLPQRMGGAGDANAMARALYSQTLTVWPWLPQLATLTGAFSAALAVTGAPPEGIGGGRGWWKAAPLPRTPVAGPVWAATLQAGLGVAARCSRGEAGCLTEAPSWPAEMALWRWEAQAAEVVAASVGNFSLAWAEALSSVHADVWREQQPLPWGGGPSAGAEGALEVRGAQWLSSQAEAVVRSAAVASLAGGGSVDALSRRAAQGSLAESTRDGHMARRVSLTTVGPLTWRRVAERDQLCRGIVAPYVALTPSCDDAAWRGAGAAAAMSPAGLDDHPAVSPATEVPYRDTLGPWLLVVSAGGWAVLILRALGAWPSMGLS